VSSILEDLTTLPPKRLEKRLRQLASGSLQCRGISVFSGDPGTGLTVALTVDAHDRRDVLDLARVVEDDAAVSASCGWSFLAASRRHAYGRLLLRVSFERPVDCDFTVSFEVGTHPSDPVRTKLPLLLAADRFVFDLGGGVRHDHPLVWLAAPLARDSVLDALSATHD
jgi:hypothetical protein